MKAYTVDYKQSKHVLKALYKKAKQLGYPDGSNDGVETFFPLFTTDGYPDTCSKMCVSDQRSERISIDEFLSLTQEDVCDKPKDIIPDENTEWLTPVQVRDIEKDEWKDAVWLGAWGGLAYPYYAISQNERYSGCYRYCRIKPQA